MINYHLVWYHIIVWILFYRSDYYDWIQTLIIFYSSLMPKDSLDALLIFNVHVYDSFLTYSFCMLNLSFSVEQDGSKKAVIIALSLKSLLEF